MLDELERAIDFAKIDAFFESAKKEAGWINELLFEDRVDYDYDAKNNELQNDYESEKGEGRSVDPGGHDSSLTESVT